MKVFQNIGIINYKGMPIKLMKTDEKGQEIDDGDLKLSNVLWTILNNAPMKTQNDSIQGVRLAQALDKASGNGIIEIEEGVHDWIKPIADKLTPPLFRLNANIIYELITEGFEKSNQPEKGG